MPKSNPYAWLLLIGAAICWSFAGIFVHYLGNHVGILTQSTFRYLFASITLFIICFIVFPRKDLVPGRTIYLILLAALCCLFFQLAWVKALYIIQPGSASLIGEFGTVINIFILSFFYQEEKDTARNPLFLLSTAVMLTGVTFVIIFNPKSTFDFNIGAFLVIISSICWGLYTVVIKRVVRHLKSMVAMAYVAFFVSLYHAVLGIFKGNLIEFFSAPNKIKLIIVVSGIVSISGSHSFFYMAIKRITVVVCNNIMLFIPILVCVWSFLIFKELLTPLQMSGGSLLIFGGYLTSRVKGGWRRR
jgi:drug/metabolite transporter (DMT)-like permease